VAELAGRRKPIGGLAREGLPHDRVELRWTAPVVRRWRGGLAAPGLQQRLIFVLVFEQRAEGPELLGGYARGPKGPSRVELLAAGDRLWGHVRELALHTAGMRTQRRRLRLRDAEVDDLELAGHRDQQVRG